MLQKVVKQLKKSNGVWESGCARKEATVGPRDTKEVEKVVFRRSDGLYKKKRHEVSGKSLSVGNYIHGLGKSHE